MKGAPCKLLCCSYLFTVAVARVTDTGALLILIGFGAHYTIIKKGTTKTVLLIT